MEFRSRFSDMLDYITEDTSEGAGYRQWKVGLIISIEVVMTVGLGYKKHCLVFYCRLKLLEAVI